MTLFLLPNLLHEDLPYEPFISSTIKELVLSLHGLIAESERGGRRFMARFSHSCPIRLLNEHTSSVELDELLTPMKRNEKWGLISDAGLPCLADPGADLVLRAAAAGISVQALPGPSAPLLALQLSGLTGQRYAFHGYLPREERALRKALQRLEDRSDQDQATQIWIETPYRTARMAHLTIQTLKSTTLFCIALNLTTPRQHVLTQTIAKWRKASLNLGKEPAIFLLLTSIPNCTKAG